MIHPKSLWIGCCAVALGACSAGGSQTSVRGTAPALDAADAGEESAAAELQDATGNCVGRITFTTQGDTTAVDVTAHLPPSLAGLHAMHIHANDNPDNGEGCIADPNADPSTYFTSVDGHYNPSGATHGHHAGDLPALFFTATGDAAMHFITDSFHAADIVGGAVILHALSDNYGNIPVGDQPTQYTPNDPAATDLTARTGNAGARIACGVIE